jgi:hypothetical protein
VYRFAERQAHWGKTQRGINRINLGYLFRDTMLKLIHSENLGYKELTMVA